MSTLSPDKRSALSPYVDKALTLSEAERAHWLEALRAENPDLARQLQELLSEHQAAQQEAFLETSPIALPENPGLAGQTLGTYRLVSPLGHGGMGAVWLAERNDGRFERKAAVKFLSAALIGHGGEERFKREGAILGRLSHPKIAELLDAGVTSAGHPYLVIEYVEGAPIDEYCDRRKLDVRARVRLFLDVLDAVAHAHSHLIVHRDIKPSNVLVNAEGQVKLLDFGIAKFLEEEADAATASLLTQQAGSALTPAYAAPEQLTGKPVTVATDVYASGVLLYVLLTGLHPAGGSVHTLAELMKAIVESEPPRPSSNFAPVGDNAAAESRGTTPERLCRQLRGDLDAIVLMALCKEPPQRYPTADAFAEDLRRYLAGVPVIAQPENTWYRVKKFVSRRRWAVVSVGSVVLALAAGLSTALWQAHVARRQTQIATAMEKFLEDIFHANSSYQDDPVKARQTTARELLDIGARKIDDELAGVPEAKLSILNTLGNMYYDLGLSDQTVNLQHKRVELARKLYGNNSMEVAEALTDLGSALHASTSVSERETVLLEAKRILDQRRDFSSQQRGALSVVLAQHYESSDVQRALDNSRQAVDVYRKYPDDSMLPEALADSALNAFHPSVPAPGAMALDALKVLASRAEIALARGDGETAAHLSGQVVQEIAGSAQRDYLKALEARAALVEGRADMLRLRPSEALPLLQQAVELRESMLDPISPALAAAQIALGECYFDLGDSARAKTLAAVAKKTLASHRELSIQYLRLLQDLEKQLRQGSPLSKVG